MSLSRRQFNKLTAAAAGGLVTGSLVGCKKKEKDTKETETGKKAAATHDVAHMMEEPHVCRGLNTCKDKGQGGKNACAGQGACATAEKHECAGHNKCKGQGGCGEYPGQNACKEKGKCAVPLNEKAWKAARAAFEKAMKAKDKKFGDAPAKS